MEKTILSLTYPELETIYNSLVDTSSTLSWVDYEEEIKKINDLIELIKPRLEK